MIRQMLLHPRENLDTVTAIELIEFAGANPVEFGECRVCHGEYSIQTHAFGRINRIKFLL